MLTAAAKSICPAGAAVGFVAAGFGGPLAAGGRGAVGTGGLPGILGAGFAATGGAVGFGLAATGGGGLPARELPGRELAGDSEGEAEAGVVFFQGAADPFAGTIPGNTETGFALTSAEIDDTATLAAEGIDLGTAGPGGDTLRGGGGGAGAAAAGTSSR
jgi:hypothetical protein